MNTERMFDWSIIDHSVKVPAERVGRNVHDLVEKRTRSELEGRCGPQGFVRPGSVEMVSCEPGELVDIYFGRAYLFRLKVRLQVCNPLPGLRFPGIVQSGNKIGIMVEGGYFDNLGNLVPVLEVVVVRETVVLQNEVPPETLQPGDEVNVEVLGRVYELNDTRIRAFGRTVLDIGDGHPAGDKEEASNAKGGDGSEGSDDADGFEETAGPVEIENENDMDPEEDDVDEEAEDNADDAISTVDDLGSDDGNDEDEEDDEGLQV